jgi:hypothetical protein
MLSQKDKETILSEFPNIKLSYENIVHKKVYNSDFILAIPVGIKCFTWFTTFNDKFVCIVLELENNKKKEITNIRIINTSFSKSLCYGTLFYGTLFKHMNSTFFSIEDIYLYKNRDFFSESWQTKFNKIIDILKHDISQTAYNKNCIVFGLPTISYSNDKLYDILKSTIKYDILCVQYYQYNKTNSYNYLAFDKFNIINVASDNLNIQPKNNANEITPKNIILKIKPDIQTDVYHIYSFNDMYCGLACIPDYKTSMMMNKLFRNIKENDDLDKLEESDDENEFENPNVDKFVYLDKSYKMKCLYNKRFKKWVPIEIVDNICELSNQNNMNNFINKLYEYKNNKNELNDKRCKMFRHL